MFRSLLKVAYRRIFKEKFYSLVKISGVAVAVASAILIILYVHNELTYDAFHEHSENIYRVNLHSNWEGEDVKAARTPPPLAKTMDDIFPEVEAVTRLFPIDQLIVKNEKDNVSMIEENVYASDSEFFRIFDFDLLEGEEKTALSNPSSIVLSLNAARKYFGTTPAIGKSLLVDGEPYKVTGIVDKFPENSHLSFDVLISISSVPVVERFDWNWLWCQLYTYVLLKEAGDAASVEQKIPGMMRTYADPLIKRFTGYTYDEYKENGGAFEFYLQPFESIHISEDNVLRQPEPSVSPYYLYAAIIVAISIVLIACINFINLSTASATRRAKEVGVRKALGAIRKELIYHYLIESMLMTVVAFVLAVVLVAVTLGVVGNFGVEGLKWYSLFTNGWLLALLFVLLCLVGFVSGSYPAFYLSSFQAAVVLKGKATMGKKKSWLRDLLVISQFAISSILITCTLIVSKQINFMSDRDLGLAKENVVVIKNIDKAEGSIEALRNSYANLSSVKSVATAENLPGKAYAQDYFRAIGQDEDVALNFFPVSDKFVETLDIQLKSGRSFSKEFLSDQNGIILNEAAVEKFQLNEPLNSTLFHVGAETEYRVIGVVKNFNYESLKEEIKPCAMVLSDGGKFMTVRVEGSQLKTTLTSLEQQWSAKTAGMPFDYFFLNESFDELFHFEKKMSSMITNFSILAVFISCIGLLGLAMYTTELKNKEMGIRKVLGASTANIMFLLSKDYLKVILIAFFIALPVSYYIMSGWLQDFHFRVSMGATEYIAGMLLILVISGLTVLQHLVKISSINPIRFLKEE